MDHDGLQENSGCEELRASMSAGLDGELTSAERLVIDGHILACGPCQVWLENATRLRRTLVMRSDAVPLDLADRVLAEISQPLVAAGSWVRYALAVVAASLVLLNLPGLFAFGSDADHSMRHAGAFGVALGVGLVWAAWRPERAMGLVPLALALVAAVVVGSVFDLATGRAAALSEALHILEVVGVALLVLLANGGIVGLRQRYGAGFRSTEAVA